MGYMLFRVEELVLMELEFGIDISSVDGGFGDIVEAFTSPVPTAFTFS